MLAALECIRNIKYIEFVRSFVRSLNNIQFSKIVVVVVVDAAIGGIRYITGTTFASRFCVCGCECEYCITVVGERERETESGFDVSLNTYVVPCLRFSSK